MPRRLDARGYLCPMPTALASLAIEEMASGDVLELVADDPTTRRDLPGWCREFGHDLQSIQEKDGHFVLTIRKSHAH